MITKFGPTWNSSHVYGQGLVNNARGLYYCQIPKCASIWMRTLLTDSNPNQALSDRWDGCDAYTPDIETFTPIIILRDPIERWISNCPSREQIVEISSDKSSSDYVFENLESWLWDEHSARQFDFIQWLDLSKAVFFFCDDSLSSNVKDYLDEQGFNLNVPKILNQQSTDDVTKIAAKTWREILSVKEYRNKFYDTFRQDYDLIRSVDFYGRGKIYVS